MKCSKCGNEMRMAFSAQNGQQTATCDSCNYTINVYNPAAASKKKFSPMSIVAFILSFFCCFSVVGLILGIIDLVRNDQNQKHGLSIAAVVISVIWIGFFGLFYLTDTDDSTPSDTQTYGSEVEIQEPDTELVSESESTPSETEETIADRETFISQCQSADYKALARYPDDHIGDKIALTVRISQVVQGGWFDSNEYYQVYTDNDGYGLYLDDEYYMYDMRVDDDTRLLKDDIIVIYGEYAGLQEVTRAFSGTDEYVPAIKAYYIDIIE